MNKLELEKVLGEHKKWLVGGGGQRAYLQRAYLQGANLQGADLQGANLQGANLRGADLQGANLQGADLRGAYLRGADLQRADLQGADLRGANLQGAYLQRADLQGAYLQRAYLRGADLRGADLQGAYLQRADLRGADLQGAYLRDTIYDGVNWLLLLGIVPDSEGKARAYKVTTNDGEGVYNGGINYANSDKFSVPKVDKDLNQQCSYGINLANLAWCLTEYQEDRRLFLMEFDASPKNCICPIGSDGKFRVKECTKIGECDWKGNLLK